VIVNDAPALREALPDKREDAADVAFVLVSSEMPVSQNKRAVVAGEVKFELGKGKVTHRRTVGIALFVARVDRVIAALRSPHTGKRQIRGVPVSLHERIDVTFVPVIYLIRKELRDRGSV
jgi:hypothetical protein